MGGFAAEPCHRLPFVLDVCPTCGAGIRPSRAWTWIKAFSLFDPSCYSIGRDEKESPGHNPKHCPYCVICRPGLLEEKRSGLIWIGEKFYPFPEDFIRESNAMGISRRITAVPRGFVLGETWVFVAHKKASSEVENGKATYKPGIFQVYRPSSIEYVVTGEESDEELENMVKRGITPIKVEHDGQTSNIPLEDGPPAKHDEQ